MPDTSCPIVIYTRVISSSVSIFLWFLFIVFVSSLTYLLFIPKDTVSIKPKESCYHYPVIKNCVDYRYFNVSVLDISGLLPSFIMSIPTNYSNFGRNIVFIEFILAFFSII